jgi:hypothetical protein
MNTMDETLLLRRDNEHDCAVSLYSYRATKPVNLRLPQDPPHHLFTKTVTDAHCCRRECLAPPRIRRHA